MCVEFHEPRKRVRAGVAAVRDLRSSVGEAKGQMQRLVLWVLVLLAAVGDGSCVCVCARARVCEYAHRLCLRQSYVHTQGERACEVQIQRKRERERESDAS